MKVELQIQRIIQGYSKLYGVHHSRIKAKSKRIYNNSSSTLIDHIQKLHGSYTEEYRIVKEPHGYIFREVLLDTSINGHFETVKKLINSTLYFVNIYIDEEYEFKYLPEFLKTEKHQLNREKCKHKNKHYNKRIEQDCCPDCDIIF